MDELPSDLLSMPKGVVDSLKHLYYHANQRFLHDSKEE